MRAGVVTFPGSNCDRDLMVALRDVGGFDVVPLWYADRELPALDLIGLPGGFAYGDYLRCGAIAARAPIMSEIVRAAQRGVHVLGICNGFQVLTEAGLLPGAMIRNAGLSFVCRWVRLEVATTRSAFTEGYRSGSEIRLPVAHHDGNFQLDADAIKALEDGDRIALRYAEPVNGSQARIAGILNDSRNVLGLMPHPERAIARELGGGDGATLFKSLASVMGNAFA